MKLKKEDHSLKNDPLNPTIVADDGNPPPGPDDMNDPNPSGSGDGGEAPSDNAPVQSALEDIAVAVFTTLPGAVKRGDRLSDYLQTLEGIAEYGSIELYYSIPMGMWIMRFLNFSGQDQELIVSPLGVRIIPSGAFHDMFIAPVRATLKKVADGDPLTTLNMIK